VPVDAVGTIDWEVATPVDAGVDARKVAERMVDAAWGRNAVSMNGKV